MTLYDLLGMRDVMKYIIVLVDEQLDIYQVHMNSTLPGMVHMK